MPFIYNWSEAEVHNPNITAYLTYLMLHDPHTHLGMSDGWSSQKDLQRSWVVKPLLRFIQSKSLNLSYTLEAWGNILQRGQSIGPHNHILRGCSDGCIAGVYYLTPGTLKFEDGGIFHLHPGQLMIFKGDKVHEVPPVSDLRVTIAFNLRLI